MRPSGLFRFLAFIFALVTSLIFIRSYVSFRMKTIRLPRWLGPGSAKKIEVVKIKCDLSSYARQLGFRDSWVFLGARDMSNKSPFEQYLKNMGNKNKYEGWPELLELEGCVPRKVF
uniref:FAM3 metabolism regulating signaling molecule D n=1 Tax=Pipistrellus kuhlii TaxID=59472 RepID=A0A7J7WCK6_PIPKU|nr:FAM3 metabolism regulating signaling molecule D [Pipistrellus kuhlii]